MKIRYIVLLILVANLFSACSKFLDVKPKGIVIPEKLADYEGVLNAPAMNKTFPINLLDFADDNFNKLDQLSQSATANGYYWRPIITVNENASPDVWGPLYNSIYSTNVVINGVMEAADGTVAQKERVKAEALVVRAYCYLNLLTVFGKAYDPATAATDPGLPLVTSINVTDKVPARSSVQVTLDGIINDVSTAIPALPESNINRYRVSKYAAYSLLSRVYLYMANYPKAKEYADLALLAPHTLLNYNNYTAYTQLPVYDLNPEVLWQRSAISGSPVFMLYSADLKSFFDSSDIRYQFLTVTNNNGLGRASLPGTYNFGTTFPEMYLTKAELLAREGKFNEAMAIVNDLRKKRIKTASYADQAAANGEDALLKVLAERRRELAYSGVRWFDMKRLDREGRMPEVRRINPDTQGVDASLPPHSPKYTFEIPVRVTLFNPGMERNFK